MRILPSASYIDYVPVGVVGAITAYNLPLHPVLLKIGAALAAGCTIVATPSQRTPYATLLLAPSTVRAFDEGKPSCAISLVTGCKAPRRSRLHEGTQPEGQACRFVDDALAAHRGTCRGQFFELPTSYPFAHRLHRLLPTIFINLSNNIRRNAMTDNSEHNPITLRRNVLRGGVVAAVGILGGTRMVVAAEGDTIKVGFIRALTGRLASSFAPTVWAP